MPNRTCSDSFSTKELHLGVLLLEVLFKYGGLWAFHSPRHSREHVCMLLLDRLGHSRMFRHETDTETQALPEMMLKGEGVFPRLQSNVWIGRTKHWLCQLGLHPGTNPHKPASYSQHHHRLDGAEAGPLPRSPCSLHFCFRVPLPFKPEAGVHGETAYIWQTPQKQTASKLSNSYFNCSRGDWNKFLDFFFFFFFKSLGLRLSEKEGFRGMESCCVLSLHAAIKPKQKLWRMCVDKKVIYLQIQVFVSRNYQKRMSPFFFIMAREYKKKTSCFVVFLMLAQSSCPLFFFFLYICM